MVHVERQFLRLLLVHAVSCLCSSSAAAITIILAREEPDCIANLLLSVLYHSESLLRVAVVI